MLDPYAALGINKKASSAVIRKAFLLKARQLHPDTGGETANAEKFAQAHKAYEVLMNAEMRKKYDALGIIDSEPEGKRKQAAIDTLKGLFNQIVASAEADVLESADILQELRTQIAQQRAEIKKGHAKLVNEYKKKERVLEVIQERIHRRGGADIFTEALQEALTGMLAPIAKVAENVLIGDEMLNLLAEYEYHGPQRVSFYQFSNCFTFTALG